MHLILSLAFPGSLLSNMTAFQFLIAGALLLGVAAILMAISREHRISLKRSGVSDELAIHLGRIADALDRIAVQTREQTHFAAPQKPEISETVRPPNENPHPIAYSMFGR
jgi:hypothetical protein